MSNRRGRSKLIAVEKTKKVTATVVLSTFVDINVLKTATPEQIKNAILGYADTAFEIGGIDLLITECSEEGLVD